MSQIHALDPVITVQPLRVTRGFGQSGAVALTVTAVSLDGGVLSYAWKNSAGTAVGTNAATYSYTPANVTTASATAFYVVVTNTITAGAGDGGVKTKTAQSATATIAVKTAKDRITEASGTTATITLYADETVAAFTVNNVNSNITLVGSGAVRVLTLSANGSNAVSAGVLTLGNNVTLKGKDANNSPVVYVSSTGTLNITAGATITGNTNCTASGGLRIVGGIVNMSGGTITGNSSKNSGGGVYADGGVFNMTGGTISNNATIAGGYGGGGVFIHGCTFTMSGGTMYGNSSLGNGGAVWLYQNNGSFTKLPGGVIYGDTDTTHTAGTTENTSGGNGHAVCWGNVTAKYNGTLSADAVLSSVTGAPGRNNWQ
jgi:hypothetical protein